MDHLRRDLKDIFNYAQAEGVVTKNPALLLFTPRTAKKRARRVMERKEAEQLLGLPFPTRERLIILLAMYAGMRPSEIFGLQWQHVGDDHVVVAQRVYRGKIDMPKTENSCRTVALAMVVQACFTRWKSECPKTGPNNYVFASEKGDAPLRKDNAWGWRTQEKNGKRYQTGIKPILDDAGLGWVNFQVLRRTHASIMRSLDVHPKTVADQLGHTLDVNQNIYTSTPLSDRLVAVQVLESALNGAERSKTGLV